MADFNTPVPKGYSTGLIPRPYHQYPVGCFAFAPAFPDSELIDVSEWPDRWEMLKKAKANLLAVRDAYYEDLKSLDQDGFGLCVIPGTRIHTIDGGHCIVENIKIGYEVMTAEGNHGKVVETYQRAYNGELVGLSLGYEPLWLTPNHRVLTPMGYVPAGELNRSHMIADWSRPERSWSYPAITRKNYDGIVHNFAVTGDNSYIADRIGVHNCWAFSSTKAVMYIRFLMGLPPAQLSAWYVAGIINKWRDQGGWGASSLGFIVSTGIPLMTLCPKYSSSYDTAETRANAALNKCVEWWDGSDDPTLAQKQLVSTLLRGRPAVVDLNVLSHSMCAIDIGSLSPLEIVYDNSWGTGGEKGLYRAVALMHAQMV